MKDIILIIVYIEIGIRVFPLLDSLTELINHFIAIGIQKCDSTIRKIALKSEEEEMLKTNNSLPAIGFVTSADEVQEKDDFNEN